MTRNINRMCRICGFEYGEQYPYGEFFPWGEDGTLASFDGCDCCGATWGYHDSILAAIRNHRERWLASGAKWHDPKFKPENWNLEEQLKNIPEKYR